MYALDPFKTRVVNGVRQPVILAKSRKLYDASDVAKHPDIGGANLAVEASPSGIGDVIYITAGSGHVYGLDRKSLKVVWDYKTGSDIDGTPVVNYANKLLVTIEKQYISENGGLFLFDPTKTPKAAPLWYFPTPVARHLGVGGRERWLGVAERRVEQRLEAAARGVLERGRQPLRRLAGRAHLSQGEGTGSRGPGSSSLRVAQEFVGASISTPAFVGDRIVVGGYDRKIRVLGLRYTTAKKGQPGALPSPDGRWWKATLRPLSSLRDGRVGGVGAAGVEGAGLRRLA